jgi:hypothetical protein
VLAREGGDALLFLGLIYIAYEKQFRDHVSTPVPKVASGAEAGRETYCSMCLMFHMDQPHAPARAPRLTHGE